MSLFLFQKLRPNKNIDVISREIFLVQKKDKEPIKLLLEKVLTSEWKIIQDGGKPKVILELILEVRKRNV